MRRIDLIVVHCSATKEGSTLSAEALNRAHKARGFVGTGYHYYIRRDGTVHATRPLERIGAHAFGYNGHSIGICYEGGLDSEGRPADTRTPEQRTMLRLLVAQLQTRFQGSRVCGHNELSRKACPCFDVQTEL